MHTEPSSPHSCRARPLLLILGIATVATLLHSAAPFLSEAVESSGGDRAVGNSSDGIHVDVWTDSSQFVRISCMFSSRADSSQCGIGLKMHTESGAIGEAADSEAIGEAVESSGGDRAVGNSSDGERADSGAPFLSEAEPRGLLKPEPCKDIGLVATTLITDGVNFVLAEIPGSRIQAKTRELGIQAEVKVGVGMASSTTKITNITYNACSVGGLKMTSCKTRGKLVQVVPDTVALRVEGLVLNITIEYWSGVAVVGRGNTKNMTVTGHACEPAVASPLSPPFSANAR